MLHKYDTKYGLDAFWLLIRRMNMFALKKT